MFFLLHAFKAFWEDPFFFFPCTTLCEDIRTHLIRVLLSLSCFQESAAIVTDSCEDVSGEECEESRFVSSSECS